MLKIYHYKNCSSCKKALKYLSDNSVAFEAQEITEKVPSKQELLGALAAYEGNIKKLFNTSGKIYRDQQISKKLATMEQNEAIALLLSEGMLIKRPFLVAKSQYLVGFKEDQYQTLIP